MLHQIHFDKVRWWFGNIIQIIYIASVLIDVSTHFPGDL